MHLSTKLAQLALAGIASGLVATATHAKDKAGMETPVMKDSAAVKDMPMGQDTAAAATAQHECKGMNSCKGMGGCAVTRKELKEMAKKAGVPMKNAGKAHSCKGKNECKGLGGCKS